MPRVLCAAFGALVILLTSGYTSAHAMNFSMVRVNNGDPLAAAIVMAGAIRPGDADRFTNYVVSARASNHVVGFVLDSPGGSVFEAERMASALRALGAAVLVGPRSPCLSACFLLFAAGVQRFAETTAVIGVHSASIDGHENRDSLATTTLMARTAAAFGVPPSVITALLTTGPQQIVELNQAELAAMNVHLFEVAKSASVSSAEPDARVDAANQDTEPTKP